jgi:Cof subfamily protein (haloacid dehalogenase superfamily)
MIKLFVSDMDGTLLYNESNTHARDISLENYEAVQKLHNSGVRFMMASGRDHFYRLILEKEFGFQVDAIGMNGCNVVIDNEVLCDHGLTHQDTVDVLETLKNAPVEVNFLGINSNGDHVFQYVDREPYQRFYELHKQGVFKHMSDLPLSEWIKDETKPPFNKLVGLVKTVKDRDILLDFFEKEYGDRLDVIYSGLENIELMPKGISKGNALLELMELKGYKPTEVATIGDSMNDITMLQVTPYSFAMSHSDAIVKESSHYIVKSVAEAIEMVLKINEESNGL